MYLTYLEESSGLLYQRPMLNVDPDIIGDARTTPPSPLSASVRMPRSSPAWSHRSLLTDGFKPRDKIGELDGASGHAGRLKNADCVSGRRPGTWHQIDQQNAFSLVPNKWSVQ